MNEGESAWESFCAGIERTQHAPAARKAVFPPSAPHGRAASAIEPLPAIGGQLYLPAGEDFSTLLALWESGRWESAASASPTPRTQPGKVSTARPAKKAVPTTALAALRAWAGQGHARPSPRDKSSAAATPMHLQGQVDANTARRLTRGQLVPEAVLDLHGQTLPQAFESLLRLIALAEPRGWRLLLVITGKGRTRGPREGSNHPIEGEGKLRQALPHWLADPRIAPYLVTARTAHARHGGSGAFYLLLRRRAGRA